MPAYRCYFLDSERHIRGVDEFTGADDDEAILKARRIFAELDYYSGFEIWQGARRLATDPQGAALPNRAAPQIRARSSLAH